MKKAAIIVSDFMFPPKGGLYEMTINLIACVVELGYEVDLLGFCSDINAVDTDQLNELFSRQVNFILVQRKISWGIMGLRPRLLPKMLLNNKEQALIEQLASKSYKFLVFEGVGASGFHFYANSNAKVLNIIDPPSRRYARFSQDKNYHYLQRLKFFAQSLMAILLEKSLSCNQSIFNVVSPADAKYLASMYKNWKIATIPVCLKPNFSAIDPQIESVASDRQYFNIVISIDLTQSYLYSAFLNFLYSGLIPALKKHQQLNIHVVCKKKPESKVLNDCNGLNIAFSEWVQDLNHEILNADLIVLPDGNGTGLKNRTVLSMALGKPIVATKYALEGIPVTNNIHAIVLEDFNDFVTIIDEILDENINLSALATAGQKLAYDCYSFESFKKQWFDVIQRVCYQ